VQPERIHITMAAPASYAALLGHHMTALHADVITYELDDHGYTPAVTLASHVP
jgi:hypothetical protein